VFQGILSDKNMHKRGIRSPSYKLVNPTQFGHDLGDAHAKNSSTCKALFSPAATQPINQFA